MKLLVLGGAGYVGSAFVYRALDKGHDLVVYDSLEHGHRHSVPKEASFVHGDILDTKHLASALSEHKPDAILHYAAYAVVPESVREPRKYYRNNVAGVISVFEAMASSHRCPMVFSSTCAVFGTPKTVPLRENDAKNPESPYGRTKWMAEAVIADCAQELGVSAAAFRYFNASGADLQGRCGEEHQPETHLIPNILAAVHSGKSVTIFGKDFPTRDGTCVRDYIHVTDLADAHLLGLEFLRKQKTPRFEAIHLGTGRGTSNLEIVAAVERVLAKKVELKFGERRAGDPSELYSDPSYATSLLGFEPKHSDIDTIVRTASDFYLRCHSK